MKRKKNKSTSGSQMQAVQPQNNPLVTALELQQQGKMVEAESLFRQILHVAPVNEVALYSLAVILLNSGRHEEALLHAITGTKANPGFSPLWFVHASALQALHRRDEALACYDKALAINPKYIEVLVNSGAMLRDMRRHHDALKRFHTVLEIDPEYETALSNYGILLTEFKQGPQAVAIFERLLQKNPNYPYGLGLLCYERMHLCDWTDIETITEQITAGIHEGKKVCKTLGYMALSDSAADHFLCAKIFAKGQHPTRPAPLWKGERYRHSRIRIAYVSPDLREHPVGHLMAGVFEGHDKSCFETIAISIGVDDGSRLRARMVAAFDHFIDAKDMHPLQIAELMRQMEVDIAVDLAGYTSDAKTEIFLNRPAPVQINYLGYPGTLGLECYDYILADRTVIPEDDQAYYTERVAYLDHCYLPIASGIEVAEPKARSFYGLPENGFVYCAFSHDYKIHPKIFAVWMRLLESTPESVLWLVSRNEVSQSNLRQAAQKYGISPDRLIFATRVPNVEDHLARYRVADLFLDTWPYNAHTTAADALLAGLPVVTYKGTAFPARVAASLLETLGVNELVTNSFDDYFDLANGLAHNTKHLQKLRELLSPAKLHGNKFLGKSFTATLEKVFSGLIQSILMELDYQHSGSPTILTTNDLIQNNEQVFDIANKQINKGDVVFMPKVSPLNTEELKQKVEAFPFWYHRIELPGGIVTPGWAPLSPGHYAIPEDMTGLRVLDVGAWDGYWTFEALKRGAREVVAIDDFSDFLGRLENEDRRAWENFDLCKNALGYSDDVCKRYDMSVYDVTEEKLGQFDVVFFFGTLYHLRHPLLALDKLSAVCKREIYVESAILDDYSPYQGGFGHGYSGDQTVMEFYPNKEYGGNDSNWWTPTLMCMAQMVSAAGYSEVLRWRLTQEPATQLPHCRGFVKGTKKKL